MKGKKKSPNYLGYLTLMWPCICFSQSLNLWCVAMFSSTSTFALSSHHLSLISGFMVCSLTLKNQISYSKLFSVFLCHLTKLKSDPPSDPTCQRIFLRGKRTLHPFIIRTSSEAVSRCSRVIDMSHRSHESILLFVYFVPSWSQETPSLNITWPSLYLPPAWRVTS